MAEGDFIQSDGEACRAILLRARGSVTRTIQPKRRDGAARVLRAEGEDAQEAFVIRSWGEA